MAIMNWNDSYSVNITSIDIQHKKLIDMINALHDAMAQGKGRDVMAPMVRDMATYAVTHFANEEKLMQEKGYPDFAAHKAQHDAFKQKVGDFQAKVADNKLGVTLEVMNFLKDWLSNHILSVDKKYAPFLNEKGIH